MPSPFKSFPTALLACLAVSTPLSLDAQTRRSNPPKAPVRTTVQQADLSIRLLKTGSAKQVGSSIEIPVTCLIQNTGRGHAKTFNLGASFVLDPKSRKQHPARILISSRPAAIPSLRANSNTTVKTTIVIPNTRHSLDGKTITLALMVDQRGQIRESNERNNFVRSKPIRIPAHAKPVRTNPKPVRTSPSKDALIKPQKATLNIDPKNPAIPKPATGVKTQHPPKPTTPGNFASMQLQPVYVGNDGGAYYVAKNGNEVVFFGEHPGQEDYACVFRGTLSGTTITGSWWDTPKGGRTRQGSLTLRATNNGKGLKTVSQTGSFNVSTWSSIKLGSFTLPGKRPASFSANTVNDLDGAWTNGDQTLYLRESGTNIVGVMESKIPANGQPAVARVVFGKRNAQSTSNAHLKYIDIPKGLGKIHGSHNLNVLNAGQVKIQNHGTWIREGYIFPTQVAEFFSIDRLAEEIEKRLDGKCVGYGYAIAHNGKLVHSGSGGSRLLSPDGAQLPFTPDTQKGVQSTSKTITAAAVMHLLQKKGFSIDTRIDSFLPAYWERGPMVSELTFKHLLRHYSGLQGVGDPDEFENLRTCIKNGSIHPDFSWISPSHNYQNANTALFRIIIPYLEDPVAMKHFEEVQGARGSQLNKECSKRYINYVRKHILLPAGITNPSCYYTSQNIAPSYNFERQDVKGRMHTSDQLEECGAGGWVLSAKDYTKFVMALENKKLITVGSLIQMKQHELGLFQANGAAGTYYFHGGAIGGNPDEKGNGDVYGQGRGARAAWMSFPNNIQVSIQVNSANNGFGYLPSELRKAYDAAVQ